MEILFNNTYMKNTALITGASSGLGKEFAIIHAQAWNDLVIVARRKAKLVALKKQLETDYNIQVKVIEKDLTEKNACIDIYWELEKEKIEIEYLINNAGFGWIWKFYERKWEDNKAMIDLNINVLTELTRLFLPDFVKRNSGKILNVSSTASLLPGPGQAVYYATKAYVTSFSNAIHEELFNTDVSVTALLPGATETEFGTVSGMDKTSLFSHTASAESVANDWYQAMLKWQLNVISGLNLPQKILMKIIPFLPKKVLLKQIRQAQEVS